MTDLALTLDCRGMRCPRPIIVLSQRIGEAPAGGLVEIWADDPAAGPDLAAWCRMRGHELVLADGVRFVVRRTMPTPN